MRTSFHGAQRIPANTIVQLIRRSTSGVIGSSHRFGRTSDTVENVRRKTVSIIFDVATGRLREVKVLEHERAA